MDDNPFQLGFEGEEYDPILPGLRVPIPGTNTSVLVVESVSGHAVVTGTQWIEVDGLLMAAAVIHRIFERFDQLKKDT